MENYKIEELERAIKRTGLRQIDLAKETGISQTHISQFLTGKRSLSFFTYCKLCRAINRDPQEFLTKKAKELLTKEL